MPADDSRPAIQESRWFHPTPGRMLVVLLAVEGVLFLCDWFQWTPKGSALLISIAAVVVTIIVMLLWFAVAFVFRSRFQFSIRSLLLLTVAVAISCSWLAMEIKRAREQREAVESIRSSGGMTSDIPFADEPPPEPEWTSKLGGEHFFHDVTSVMFFSREITDAVVVKLKGFPRLRSLTYMEADLTNETLNNICKIKNLNNLSLISMNITENGFAHLQELPELESLHIACTTFSKDISPSALSDKGLTYLTMLRRLKSLRLTDTRVTAEGVRRLQQALPNCKIERE